MKPKRIGLIGFEGVTALHLVAAADAFAAATLDDGYGGRIACYDLWTVGVRTRRFHGESGVTFTAGVMLHDAPEFDSVIIAGGSGTRRNGVAEEITAWLLTRAATTRRIGIACSGIYAVAPSGLLDGREVATHWRIASDVARRFPRLRVTHRRALVQDGPFYTASGLSAGINLPLTMVREDYGEHVANSVARELALQLSATEQSDRAVTSQPAVQPIDRFADLVAWIMRNLHAELSVEALARRACMCPDHFSKAFKSVMGEPPSTFVENLRLNEAQRRLTKTQKTVQSVAASVGFADAAAFQRAFKRKFGARPSRCLQSPRGRHGPEHREEPHLPFAPAA